MNAIQLKIPDHGALKVHLHQSSYFTLPAAEPMALEVLSGCAWITQSGDREDHFLGTGERFNLPGRGEAIVQAMSESEIAVFPGQPGKPAGWAHWFKEIAAQFWSPGAALRTQCQETVQAATECWRNVIARQSAARLGLERTF